MLRQRSATPVTLAVLLACSLGGCAPVLSNAPKLSQPSREFAASQPRLAVEGLDHWSSGFDAAYAVALRNLHRPNSFHTTLHARAAPAIRGVHLWDSAFLSHVWKAWDHRVAQEINQAVLQKAKDGRVPHFSHRILRSQLTQPPVIAWSIWENFLWSADTAYIAAAYPALEAYDEWLHANRRLPSGLFFWRAPFESGMDNSPRFDAHGRRGQRDLRQVAAVDLSAYVALQSAVLGRMAEVLGLTAERAFHEANAAQLRELINRHLWDEDTGLYYDRDELHGELIRVRTAASLLPLFAGVPDAARAQRLRDHAMRPGSFNTLIPLPTVARDDAAYGKDMWRGPVWINVSYMIIRGLDEYGFHEEAAELAFATVDGVFRTHARTAGVWEYYDPERFDIRRLQRKRGELLKRLTLGNKPLPEYGWSALVNTLVVEYLIGYRRSGEARWIEPRLPESANGLRLSVTLPGEAVVVRVEALGGGRARGEVQAGLTAARFELAGGERYLMPAAGALAAADSVP